MQGAGLVIVATPVLAMREVFEQIAPDLAEGAVVTDTGSTKAHILKWADELLPPHVSFVGGHPMAGKEHPGIEHAEAELFRGRAYCICPSLRASEPAVKAVVGLARVVGATPVYIDPAEHDVYAAAVSHLPLVVSTALFNLVRRSPSWPDMGLIAASGFRDATRLASGDPAMSHGIWATNREAIIHWLERMTGELNRIRTLLQDARDEELLELFGTAQAERDEFIRNPPGRRPKAAAPEGVTPGEQLMRVLVGGMVADQMKRAAKIPELMQQRAAEAPARGGEGAPPGKVRPSLAEKIADDVRRDLEKLERKRAEKEGRRQDPAP